MSRGDKKEVEKAPEIIVDEAPKKEAPTLPSLVAIPKTCDYYIQYPDGKKFKVGDDLEKALWEEFKAQENYRLNKNIVG